MSPPPGRAELLSLTLADPPAAWRALGFAVGRHGMMLGSVEVQLGAPGRGIVGWQVSGLRDEIDGLPLGLPGVSPTAVPHPNGAVGIDHVVAVTPDFDRTATALDAAGLGLRRLRLADTGARQGFRRLGPAILEIVEAPSVEAGPARFWGLVVVVSDLDGLAARLGDRLSSVKDAVQPGRRIATLATSAGLQEAVAFMDPEP